MGIRLYSELGKVKRGEEKEWRLLISAKSFLIQVGSLTVTSSTAINYENNLSMFFIPGAWFTEN